MGKREFENAGEAWDPEANQDQVTDPDARVRPWPPSRPRPGSPSPEKVLGN